MSKLYNRAGVETTTAGTGTITLGSALGVGAVPNLCSMQTFANAGVQDGETISYLILDANGAWEYGTGTYTASGTTLSRTLGQSSTGALLNLSGSAQVFVTARKEDIANLNEVNSFAAACTFLNSSGIKIKDTNASHTLGVVVGSDLTADRTLTITPGDSNRTLTLGGDTTLNGGTHSGTNTGDQTVPAAATQAEEEAASSTTVYTSPGRQHYHPGSAKAWIRFNASSGTPTSDANYGVSSLTDNGVGDVTINFSTSFSAATAYGGVVVGSQGLSGGNGIQVRSPGVSAPTTSAWRLETWNVSLSAKADFTYVDAAFYGDL